MKQYIEKSAVVAEIDKRIEENKADIQRATSKHLEEYFEGYEDALVLFKEKFLDTIEIKEINLDKEIKDYFDNQPIITRSKGIDYQLIPSNEDIAKYFFNLGLKVYKGE